MSTDLVVVPSVYDINATIAIERAKTFKSIVSTMRNDDVLVEKVDYGVIPGTGNKPTLLKPGAERLCSAFGLAPDYELTSKQESWDPTKPLFHYEYRCTLYHVETGKRMGSGIGSCNSMESRYRWRWVKENAAKDMGLEPSTLISKSNQWGKTYRVENDSIFDLVNTISKIAQKRALIAAVLVTTNASEFFTQDVEDLKDFIVDGEIVEDEPAPRKPAAKKNDPKPQQPKEAWHTPENIDKLLHFIGDKLHLSHAEIMGLAGVKGKDDVEGWGKYESGKAAGAAIEAAFNAVLDVAPKHQQPAPQEPPEEVQPWHDGLDRDLLEGMILDNFTKFSPDDYKKVICGKDGDWSKFGSLNAAQQAVIDYVLKSNHPITTQLVKRPHNNYVEFQAGRGTLKPRLYGRDQLRKLFPDFATEIDGWKVGNDPHKLDTAIRITEYNVKDNYIEVVKIERIDIPF